MPHEAIVYIVDDDPAVRKSLGWLIESVGLTAKCCASAAEFLKEYNPAGPGCLVLDIRMPGMSGIELQERMDEMGLEIPIIIVTAYGDVTTAVRAMKAGAVDFLEKPISDQVLLDHIQRSLENDRHRRELRANHAAIEARLKKLTRREKEVMQMVIDGKSSKQVATELGVSFKTVEAHRAKIMKKMEVRSVPQLIRVSLATIGETLPAEAHLAQVTSTEL